MNEFQLVVFDRTRETVHMTFAYMNNYFENQFVASNVSNRSPMPKNVR